MKKNKTTTIRLVASVILILLLAICLSMTTFSIVWSTVSKENQLFHTGTIKINLNDGKPIIEEHEFLFEPGMKVQKEFFIENQSSETVYYKLYFDDIDGGLADILEISINKGKSTLFEGKMKNLTRKNVKAANDVLKLNERRDLVICFYFPIEADNHAQNQQLSFTMKADAVQTKNNPNKIFD